MGEEEAAAHGHERTGAATEAEEEAGRGQPGGGGRRWRRGRVAWRLLNFFSRVVPRHGNEDGYLYPKRL